MIKLCVECSVELGEEREVELTCNEVFRGFGDGNAEFICQDCYETHIDEEPRLSQCVRCEDIMNSDYISIINDLPYCDYCKSKLDEN